MSSASPEPMVVSGRRDLQFAGRSEPTGIILAARPWRNRTFVQARCRGPEMVVARDSKPERGTAQDVVL